MKGKPVGRRVPRTSIGLDIGSAAVRAMEVRLAGGRWEVRRFAQVGLPPGAVVDGEIRSEEDVAAAVRRLWSEGGFTSRRVILGVSGTRLVVRQADVPDVPEKEMRSALGFRIEDLVPLPAANVEFDFGPIPRGPDGGSDRTIVLAAAHGDVVRTHLAVAKAAKLEVSAIDAAPLALLRALPSSPGGADLVVTVGSDLSVVAVRHAGVPAFIRILARGGGDITRVLAEATSHNLAAAEAAKRAQTGTWTEPQARAAVDAELRRLVAEVRETAAFFSSRPDAGDPVQRVYLSGGGGLTVGLVDELKESLGLPVQLLELPSVDDLVEAGLSESQATTAAPTSLTALGLALWPTAEPYSRLDLFPAAVRQAQRRRRQQAAAVLAGVGVVAACGLVSGAKYLELQHVRRQIASDQQQAAALEAKARTYSSLTTLQSDVTTGRSLVQKALQGDVGWLHLLDQIGRVQPAGVTLTNFSGTASTVAGAQASAPSTAGTLGSVTMQAQFDQQIPQVSNWLVALEKVPGLQDTWVSSVSSPSASGGAHNSGQFAASAALGAKAASSRAAQVPGGGK